VQPTRTCWQHVRHVVIVPQLMMCCLNYSQLCMLSKLIVNRFVIIIATVAAAAVVVVVFCIL